MLSRYFEERGIPLQDVAGSGRTPRAFSQPQAEHIATRRHAGLFDFSFMGCWQITGRDSIRFLENLQTRDVRALKPGTLSYTLLCNSDGSVLNDATVWRHGPDHFWLFTGRRTDRSHIIEHARGYDVAISEMADNYAAIAIQGPQSHAILARVLSEYGFADLRYFGFYKTRLCSHIAWVGRLGYSGELGYEMIVPAEAAVEVWERIRADGESEWMVECGFDAANSLRVESGYILFSQELTEPTTPYELGLGRLVALHRGAFIGCEALLALHRHLPRRKLLGIKFERIAAVVPEARSAAAAKVTSQCFSPTFDCHLALGFVECADASLGRIVYTQDARRGRVVRLPFYDPARSLPRKLHLG